MERSWKEAFVTLPSTAPVWGHFFTVAPLIVVGTKENGGYNLAPKHMATPLGTANYFGFVCTPGHATYQNIRTQREFTISFPRPEQVVLASMSATPRDGPWDKQEQVITSLPTSHAQQVDALCLDQAYLVLECLLFKITDGFDDHSLIAGKVICSHVHQNFLRASEQDEQRQLQEHPLLAYLAHGRFATISETYNFPFPKGFKR